MRVTALNIYPIKSLGGISVQESYLEKRGLRDDRRMMLVDPQGVFVTQRKIAKLCRFHLSQDDSNWVVSHEGSGSLQIPKEGEGEPVDVRVWESDVIAELVSAEVDAWFSEAAEMPLRLVRMGRESFRPLNPGRSQGDDEVGFADGAPVLLIGEASLQDLIYRVDMDLEMRRFRPNIVVEGSAPYEEDSWPEMQIGEVALRNGWPCGRCVVTTINPETAETGPEPLRTLATYRKQDNRVNFGVNLVPTKCGPIRVGDELLPTANG